MTANESTLKGTRKKATIWNFFFLNLNIIVMIINGIMIVPLYVHYINISLYGGWLATGNILNWILLVDPGVSQVVQQKISYAIGQDDKSEIGHIIASGIVISIILFVLAIFIGLGLSNYVADIVRVNLKYKHDITAAFRIAIGGAACSLFAFTFNNIALGYQKTKLLGLIINMVNLGSIVLTVFMLLNNYGIYSLAANGLFTGAGTLILSIMLSVKIIREHNVAVKFSLSHFKSFSKVFTYTFSSRIFATLATNIDLILVSRYLGGNYVAILDLSRRPVKIVFGLANNVTISMLPALSHLFGSGDKVKIKYTAIKIWRIIIWFSGFLCGGFILLGHSLITNWIGGKFWIGSTNNVIMCISFFLLSIGYSLSNITYCMGDIKNNSLISTLKDGIYLVLLFFMIKYYGIIGVLIAFGLATIIPLVYYPRKTISVANFVKKDVQSIFKEFQVVGGLIIVLCIVSLSVVISFNIITLALAAITYSICFLILLGFSSESFRVELLLLKNLVFRKKGFST